MKKITFLKMMLLAFVMMAGSVMAQTETLTITRASFPEGALVYGVDDLWTVTTTSGETVTGYFDLYSTETQDNMQTRVKSPIGSGAYNNVPIPGKITKITLTGAGTGVARPWTPYLSTSVLTKDTYQDSGESQGAQTAADNAASTTWDIDTSKEYNYFYLSVTGGSAYLSSIVIEYVTGGVTPVPTITVSPTNLPPFSLFIDDEPATKEITVTGFNLTGNISAAISGTDAAKFSVSPQSLTSEGGNLTVTYTPSAAAATHTATLTLSSSGAEDVVVQLEGETKDPIVGTANETFETQTVLTGSFADGTFESETAGVTVNYGGARDEGTYPIDGKGIILRRASDSYVEFVFSEGVGNFSFDYRKAFTAKNVRQLELLVNGTQVKTTEEFGGATGEETTIYNFSHNVNTPGAVTVLIKNVGSSSDNRHVTIDNVSWTEYSGSGIYTATPVFTPAAGTYYSVQNVTLTSATENAKIYYTLDETEPTSASTLYVAGTPIVVSTSTTIKAIAYDANGENPSSIATAVYTIKLPTEVANIAELRAIELPSDDIYKLTSEAVLTLKSTTRNSKYIQDTTGAILIDDNSGTITTEYNVGDGITGIVGKLSVFNNMLQFIPVQDPGAASSTGNTVTPKELTVSQLSADDQAKLVVVKSVKIEETGTFASGTNYTITDTTGTGVLRLQYADLELVGKEIPTTAQDITGVILTFKETQQFVPISMVKSSTTDISTLFTDAKAWAFDNKVMFNATAGETVEMYNVAGQKVISRLAVEGLNSVDVNTTGVLIVKVGNRVSKVIVK